LKIVLALHQFPPLGFGGTEALTRWTALALNARGHHAQIISAVPRRRGIAMAVPPSPSDAEGVDVRFLAASARPAGTLERLALEYDDPDAGRAFALMLDELRPDVVHFFHLHGLTAAAVHAATARGIPLAVTCTDFWVECPTAQLLLPGDTLCEGPDDDRANCARHLIVNRFPASVHARFTDAVASAVAWTSRASRAPRLARAWTALRARSPRLLDAMNSVGVVLAPTVHMRSRLLDFGIAAEKILLVPYGIPPPDASRVRTGERADADGRLRIAFAGSLAPNKGAHLLLEAMRTLPDLPAEVALWGRRADAGYAQRLDRLAQGDPRIRFAGTFAAGEFASILAWADVLVIPSLWYENAPLVLLEALAHRCPVMVADVPGLTEPMRIGLDGWTFRRGEARDLAAQLTRAASDRASLRAVRAAPGETRTTADYMDDLLPIYEGLSPQRGSEA
jgi:glycosyltransferase involved in cell wall biosynthesis